MRKWIACSLALVMLVTTMASRAQAAFVASETLACPSTDRLRDLGQIRAFLEEKRVEARLAEMGFEPSEIRHRLGQLNDDQIHALATQSEGIRAGGSAEGVLIGVAIIVFIVAVILPLFGIRVWR